MRWFRGAGQTQAHPAQRDISAPRISRRSRGLAEFMRAISGNESISVLDLGSTSASNISFLTSIGSGLYNEDMLRSSREREYYRLNETGAEELDVEKFLAENMKHTEARFDAALCWDVFDFLPESLVKVTVDRLYHVLKPGGVLLAFFHTKDGGPDSPHYRYHIAGNDSLELERGPDFRLQRIFSNRHIENLFRDFSSRKFFLSRDNVREVLVVR